MRMPMAIHSLDLFLKANHSQRVNMKALYYSMLHQLHICNLIEQETLKQIVMKKCETLTEKVASNQQKKFENYCVD